jgi:hypothetical protein
MREDEGTKQCGDRQTDLQTNGPTVKESYSGAMFVPKKILFGLASTPPVHELPRLPVGAYYGP